MEIWNETCDWPFGPLESKTACIEKEEHPALKEIFGMQSTHIKTPLFRMGYWYGYNKEGQFVRKAVPQFEIVKEICAISKELYDGRSLGMRKSKAADTLGEFIFDLHLHLLQGWTEKTKEIVSPAKIQPLLKSIKRIQSLPEGLEDHLKRLLELSERLE
jgi:hypothetical protein